MKNGIAFLLLLLFSSCSESSPPPPDIDLEFLGTLQHDGRDRTYFVHLPKTYELEKEYPLIFAMHGGGMLGYEGVQGQSQLSELSDQEEFIVVYPEGIRTLGFRTWNAGNCCPVATTLNTDDVGFIGALLDKMSSEFGVDSKRVYATGFSNGGQLAYALANQFPNRFAAVSAVAGVLQDFPFQPTRAVPAIHFHSYLDETAPYEGGPSDAPNIDLDFPSVDETLGIIADQYNCSVQKEVIFSDPNTYDFFRYSSCDDDVILELYVSQNGGHSWPGGQAFAGVPITNHFNASELMWQFFQKYELP